MTGPANKTVDNINTLFPCPRSFIPFPLFIQKPGVNPLMGQHGTIERHTRIPSIALHQ